MVSVEESKLHEYLNRRINPGGSYGTLLDFPTHLEIETVNACNARCPMCTIADWERGFAPMTDGLFEKIATELDEHADTIKRVSLYRDGEPLIDKKLPDRVARLKQGGINSVAIATNVSLLDEAKAKDLLTAGLDLVIMSIDSLDKETFERIRVRLVFEEVLENTLRFIELRDQIRPETEIWVRMIRQDGNRDEWPAYNDFWSPRLSEKDRVYSHNIHNWGSQLKGFAPISRSFEPSLPCVALWSLLVVFCNGDVPLCNVDFNNKFPTGSVLTNSIQEVWQSKILQQRRNLHMTRRKADISLCDNCNVWDESPDADNISADYAAAVDLSS